MTLKGNLKERKSLGVIGNYLVKEIKKIILPRLDWSDRYVDIIYQSQNALSKKLIITGLVVKHKEIDLDDNGEINYQSFVMIYNRQTKEANNIDILPPQYHVTSIKYGPYDNGHIVVGFSNGHIIVYNSVTLSKLYEYQIF